jgi:hypothetical protein
MSRITITDLHVDLIDVDDNDQDMVKGGILSLAIIAFGVGYGIGTLINKHLLA